MLIYVTNFNASGLREWFFQRVSAVILASYTLFIAAILLKHPHLQYDTWHAIFAMQWVKIFTLFTLFSLLAHAWIGMWIVSTDYLKQAYIRITLQVLIIFSLFALIWLGIITLWGN